MTILDKDSFDSLYIYNFILVSDKKVLIRTCNKLKYIYISFLFCVYISYHLETFFIAFLNSIMEEYRDKHNTNAVLFLMKEHSCETYTGFLDFNLYLHSSFNIKLPHCGIFAENRPLITKILGNWVLLTPKFSKNTEIYFKGARLPPEKRPIRP